MVTNGELMIGDGDGDGVMEEQLCDSEAVFDADVIVAIGALKVNVFAWWPTTAFPKRNSSFFVADVFAVT